MYWQYHDRFDQERVCTKNTAYLVHDQRGRLGKCQYEDLHRLSILSLLQTLFVLAIIRRHEHLRLVIGGWKMSKQY